MGRRHHTISLEIRKEKEKKNTIYFKTFKSNFYLYDWTNAFKNIFRRSE